MSSSDRRAPGTVGFLPSWSLWRRPSRRSRGFFSSQGSQRKLIIHLYKRSSRLYHFTMPRTIVVVPRSGRSTSVVVSLVARPMVVVVIHVDVDIGVMRPLDSIMRRKVGYTLNTRDS